MQINMMQCTVNQRRLQGRECICCSPLGTSPLPAGQDAVWVGALQDSPLPQHWTCPWCAHLVNKFSLSRINHSYLLSLNFYFLVVLSWQDKAPISQERKWLFHTCANINLFPWKELLPPENAFGIFESSGWYPNTSFYGSYWRVNSS